MGYTGEGNRYVHYAKRGHFTEVSQHLCPSLYRSLLRSSIGGHLKETVPWGTITWSEMGLGKQHTIVDLTSRRNQKLHSVGENERVGTMRVEEISESPEAT